jgi:hypothetical protein
VRAFPTGICQPRMGGFSVIRDWHTPTRNSSILGYSRLAYAIREWEIIRGWTGTDFPNET